ncbi:MAG: hypothetical protein A2064_02110 [Spirochaetes bacterium GWB1_66_5]|nr:MAG: hypothetical protein A2064_02110 [Spirochaetes bacterium GWB1_66_5]
MKIHKSSAWILATVALLLCAAAGFAEEYFDHPQIGRYEGSSVIHQESSGLNEYRVGLGIARDGVISDTRMIRGKVMMTLYRGPESSSSFEIVDAYRQLLQSRGFEVLFECGKSECGEKFLGAFYGLAPFANDPGWDYSAPITQGNSDASYVLVARSGSGEPETYVSLIVSQGWHRYPVYKLDVVEAHGQAGGISSQTVAGKEGEDEASEPAGSGKAARRKAQFGIQVASDSFFGLLFCANRFEISAKAQMLLYDGFPSGDKPNDMVVVGGHAAYLFRPSTMIDVGVGMDFRSGITLSGDTVWRQYIDAGLRVGANYHLGRRFMVSGLLYPFWVQVRETDVADSYSLTATFPSAAVAVSFFF